MLVHGWQAIKLMLQKYDQRDIWKSSIEYLLSTHDSTGQITLDVVNMGILPVNYETDKWDINYVDTESPSIGNIYISNYNANIIGVSNPTKYSILLYAFRLSKEIDKILERESCESLVIVAHSMGGLVARTYIEYKDFKHADLTKDF